MAGAGLGGSGQGHSLAEVGNVGDTLSGGGWEPMRVYAEEDSEEEWEEEWLEEEGWEEVVEVGREGWAANFPKEDQF